MGKKKIWERVYACKLGEGQREKLASLLSRDPDMGDTGPLSQETDLDLSGRWAFHQLSHPIHPFWVFFNGQV